MHRILLLLFFLMTATTCVAQRAQRVMMGIQSDLIRSDNVGFFEKLQAGVEGSYYFSRKFAATGGLEWWTHDQVFAAVGARFCPIDEAFIRVRGLLNKDLAFGAGFAKPISDNLRIEAMGDFYTEGHIAIRAGIAYGLGGKP